VHSANLPAHARSFLVLYRSVSPAGRTVPVSGMVSLPRGAAPKGGWPVVSWAHGTTGVADVCAPSRLLPRPSTEYSRGLNAEMGEWIREGFAVAQTDYQGLGTAGMHPYLIGTAEGRSVIDIVSGARGLDHGVGRRWVAVGHSQGGHAALWAAALGPRWAPGLHLAGAAPLAPASHIGEQAALITQVEGNPFGGLPALIVAAALDAAGIPPATALSDRAVELYPQIEQVCLDRLSAPDSYGGVALKDLFRSGYDTAPLLKVVSANDPEDLTIRVPLLVAQGKADHTVLPGFTDQTVSDLRGRGTKITYKTYPGIDHNHVVAASRRDTDHFVDRLLGAR
jgi:pimeloyl-ACP methyl ester carboxylesterase